MNYRKKYLKYLDSIGYHISCNIETFDIHHMNEDRKDNSIENLVLIPKSLHQEYHQAKNMLRYCYMSIGVCEKKIKETETLIKKEKQESVLSHLNGQLSYYLMEYNALNEFRTKDEAINRLYKSQHK